MNHTLHRNQVNMVLVQSEAVLDWEERLGAIPG